MADNGLTLLRLALGIVFLSFGALKFFPGASPAEALAGRTIETLTLGAIPQDVALRILALWFPTETFRIFPVAPTLEGQYIIKNVVIVAAAIVLGATVRGGELSPEPVVETRPQAVTDVLR
jgi:hypothetical protein